MEGWKEIKLKELISEMGDGGTPSTLDEGNFGGDIPWVVVDDVRSEIYSTKDSLTEQGFKSCSAKMWDVGTIILTTGATIGKVGIAKVPLCTKQGITGIVCNEHANNLFIRYWLEANEEQLIRYAQGTTFKEIRTRPLGNLKIRIPNPFTKESVTEQSAIAAILSKVDEAIASVQGSISAAERLKKSLMQNLLTGRMKPDGTLRKEDEFYVDEKFGKVPVGWEVKKVSEIAENLDNLRKPIKSIDRDIIKGKIPYYGAAGIVDYINDYLFDGTYLLFGEDGENLLSRKLPQAFIVKGKFWVNNHAHILRVYDEFDINLIVNILESKKYDNVVYGSAQPKINKSDLNRIKIIIPKDIDEQKRISKSITTIDIEISTKQNKIAVLERLKKSLMQNLLTGKIRVKQ